VLFDFHGTVAQVEDPVVAVIAAAAACGRSLPPGEAAALAGAFVSAGRAGGPLPAAVPPELADVWARRDLTAQANRLAYTGLAATVACDVDGLPEALYGRLLDPAGWVAYPDTVPVLRALRAAGVRTALVSNIGFDLRPILAGIGLGDLLDAVVLSCEVGVCKPDPAIFRYACAAVGVAPAAAVMVGDTPADAAAVHAGCTALVLPADPPGSVHGLAKVLALAGIEC